jgi:predicted RNase H-like HicB family nuclease
MNSKQRQKSNGLRKTSSQKRNSSAGRLSDQLNNAIRYEIILYWSKADQAFIAEVPELPGCAADGATYQEALANAEVVIREWIETARELGRPVPEPRGKLMYA